MTTLSSLSVLNSEFNLEFRRLAAKYRRAKSSIFDASNWPLVIALETANNVEAKRTDGPSKDFIWKEVLHQVPRSQWATLNAKRKVVLNKMAEVEELSKQLGDIYNQGRSKKKVNVTMEEWSKACAERNVMVADLEKMISDVALSNSPSPNAIIPGM